MANTQTSVPVFTAGQILTAQQVTEINTGIPVFATTTTRDAAFGGTGEKTLAEGQFAYIEATNATQYYDGSTWQAVGTTPGLVCVKAETTFTAVSSLTVDSVFSSTYTNYFMTFIWSNSTGGQNNFVKMRVGGVAASTNYNRNRIFSISAGLGNELDTAQTSGRITGGSTVTAAAGMFIYRPFVAAPTIWLNQHEVGDGTSQDLVNITHTTATAYDGFEITPSSGTITGSYAIYGYSKTV